MKQRDLLKQLRRIGPLELVRHGAAHDIYRIGTFQFSIPRHNETDEHLARTIIRDAKASQP